MSNLGTQGNYKPETEAEKIEVYGSDEHKAVKELLNACKTYHGSASKQVTPKMLQKMNKADTEMCKDVLGTGTT